MQKLVINIKNAHNHNVIANCKAKQAISYITIAAKLVYIAIVVRLHFVLLLKSNH